MNKLILPLLFLISPMAHAVGEEQQIQALKALISPQQINQLIQQYQPNMKPEQRVQFSNVVQQQLNNLSPQEAAQLANAKLVDLPSLVKQHINNIPANEMKQIKQTLQLQKTPKQ
ncbi:MAG: hypothetical protein WCS87_18960 [Methylococcaceae bacterium]